MSLEDFEAKLNQVRSCFFFDFLFKNRINNFSFSQALERNALLENELEEAGALNVTVQRLRDETRGQFSKTSGHVYEIAALYYSESS